MDQNWAPVVCQFSTPIDNQGSGLTPVTPVQHFYNVFNHLPVYHIINNPFPQPTNDLRKIN